MPAAIMGEAGEHGPVIAFLGEFDVLPELSQEAGATEHKPVEGKWARPWLGHNLLGAGASGLSGHLSMKYGPGSIRGQSMSSPLPHRNSKRSGQVLRTNKNKGISQLERLQHPNGDSA
jgi:hypothetical protein